ncbi:hypothetical protein VME0621_01231 [Vibrio mediterranei]|nr:hypothetical protein [Vibrio mediterranei]SBO09138.1 hypothetical protein VME0621_01231 [Vibrio mediterranei]
MEKKSVPLFQAVIEIDGCFYVSAEAAFKELNEGTDREKGEV